MPGYSGKTLREKLGLKANSSAVFLYAPFSYIEELGDTDDVQIYPVLKNNHDFVHLFVKEKKLLTEMLPVIRRAIRDNGCVWVSWPKKSSGVLTDVTENAIRDMCLPLGLVDVKVAAIDAIWSGLKLVIRVKNRLAVDKE